MGEAFLVNPYDEERVAAVLERVLELPAEERKERMGMLLPPRPAQHRLPLERPVPRPASTRRRAARMAARPERPDALPVARALEAFRASRSRLILLDYDGTLVPFAPRPRDAVPPLARRGPRRRAWPRRPE